MKRALGWCTLLLLLASACDARPRRSLTNDPESVGEPAAVAGREGEVLELDLTGGVPESRDVGGFFELPASRTFTGLVRTLEGARSGEAKAVFVRLGAESPGWARTEELGRLLGKLREQGKPVVCHAHALDNASLWLVVSGCDRVWLSPGGEVSTVGLAGQVLYFKGALDRLKIRAQFLAAGKYKSAPEGFTREGPSEEARESLTATLASMRKSWLDGVKRARPGLKDVRVSLEEGPWTAKEAKARGLVHAIGFESQARDDALERGQAAEAHVRFGPKASEQEGDALTEIIRVLAGADNGGGGDQLAVVPVQGAISLGGGGPLGGGGVSAEALTKTLRRLGKDDSVKAVVLRIDSPGGSALGSDVLWHELMQLRKKKPIVASVGDMAASGGYYLAVAASKIVAERTSIVGSIGVFGGKVAIDEALAHVGVNAVTFPASDADGAAARAAYLSPFTPWDESTQERVKKQILSMYDLFLSRVAEGRGLKIAEVDKVAQGRIWSGAQGKDHKLVDELGGLGRALAIARKLAKLDDDAPVRVEGAAETLLEMLMLGEGASAQEVAAAVERYEARRACVLETVPESVRPFVSSLEPLLGDERVLAALPFSLTVR